MTAAFKSRQLDGDPLIANQCNVLADDGGAPFQFETIGREMETSGMLSTKQQGETFQRMPFGPWQGQLHHHHLWTSDLHQLKPDAACSDSRVVIVLRLALHINHGRHSKDPT